MSTKSLASKFVRETESFIARMLQMKGLTNKEGKPVDDIGSTPLEIDSEGRVVYVTEGVLVEETIKPGKR